MSMKTYGGNDEDFENIKPGDLDDVFELDEEGFDIESENTSDEDETESDEDYEEYAYDSEKANEYVDSDTDIVDEDSDISKDDEKLIEDIIDEETANSSNDSEEVTEENTESEEKIVDEIIETDTSTSETTEENVIPEPMFTEEGPGDKVTEMEPSSEIPEEFKEEDTEEITQQEESSNPESIEVDKETAKDFEGDTLSAVEVPHETEDVSETSEEEQKEDEEKEEIPDEIKEIVDEEINNNVKISEEEIPENIKKIVDEEMNDIPDIETPSDAEAKAKASSTEEDYKDFMINSFKARVADIYNRYKEQDLLNYIKDFGDEDGKDLIKDIYIQEFVKYSEFIDFNSIKEAKQDLWVLVTGVFADMVESYKKSGKIETTVIANKHGMNSEITGDENIEAILAHKKQQNEKYAEYKLDRTIFDISDTEDEANCSIFADKKTLDKDFYESEFYKIHKEVLESDRFADMSKVESVVIINEKTSFIPFIDYSTGVRVICIDPTDSDQYHLNPFLMHQQVKFSFGHKLKNVRLRVLYRDDCKNCPIAVISALKKIIGYKYIKDRYKISLNRNYTIGYTTEPKYINMFNYGDPDSHSPGSCTTAHEKPFNLQIGIIILDKKSENDRRSIRRNQIRRDLGQYEKVSVDDYDIQFVLSANIIKNDLRLRNPTLPANERYVEYLITQYTECNPVIIKDGLQIISACIIKEHMRNYDAGTGYSISIEYDRDGLLSPAIIGMLDERDGVTPTLGAKVNAMNVDGQFILPQSRLKLDGVFPFEKGRIDKRFFSPTTVQRKYPRDLWQNYDLTTRDGRLEFIRSRGFEEFIHLKPVQFDIEPYALNMIYSSEMIRNITRISMEMLADRNSEDSETMLFKQSELEYIKSMGNDKIGTFQKFLFSVMDYILDQHSPKNNERR